MKKELFINRFFQGDKDKYRLTRFSDGLELLNQYQASFDIILMDIEMRHMNGMDTAEKLRKTDPEVILIFMTKMAQYAAKGYDVDAIGFLVKPIDYYSFEMKMKKAVCLLEQKKGVSIVITDNYEKRVLSSEKIFYIEVIRHNVIFHTADGDFKTWSSLKECVDKLKKAYFVQTSRFHLVNLKYIQAVHVKSLLVAGEEVPLSRSMKKEVMHALTEYYGGGNDAF